MIIATKLSFRIGDGGYEATPLTLGINDEAYVRRMLATFEPSTIHRPDGSVFQAVIFPAGSFRCRGKTINAHDGENYHGVETFTAGWYAIDPRQSQPPRPLMPIEREERARLLPDNGSGLFVPVRSIVADSFKKLFG